MLESNKYITIRRSVMIKHKHHIIPKHMGGTDDPNNLVELTIEEHAEAHRLLYEQHGRWQDRVAWQGLAGLVGHDEILKKMNAAQRGAGHPFYGKSRSIETKQKISQALKGHTVSEETRNTWSEQRKGRKVSNETRQKISAGNKGKVISEEHREILRQPKSVEHKEKISAGNKGKVRSDEAKQKNRLARLGKKATDETKQKISKALTGRKRNYSVVSPESNLKRSKAMIGRAKPKIQCPHCGKEGGEPQMKQWHFNNCKGKK
jgi:NUMOD3 motif